MEIGIFASQGRSVTIARTWVDCGQSVVTVPVRPKSCDSTAQPIAKERLIAKRHSFDNSMAKPLVLPGTLGTPVIGLTGWPVNASLIFSSAFKKSFGTAPATWRRQNMETWRPPQRHHGARRRRAPRAAARRARRQSPPSVRLPRRGPAHWAKAL